jgi:cytochrome b561/polyisoprenoid-binding protein YceI
VKSNDYTPAAKGLHWLITLIIFVLFPLGWVMDDFTGLQKFQAFNLHKSLGLTVLALMVLRAVWRFFHPVPELPASIPERQRIAAHAVHALFYMGVFAITLAGWALISASDRPSVFFNMTAIPKLPLLSSLPPADMKAYHHFLEGAHGLLGWALLALIVLHIASALYHGIVLKDGVLSSMKPNFGKRTTTGLFIALLAFGASALAIGGAGKAAASEWSVKPEASQIGFEVSGGGSTTKGTFGQYKTEIEFDPDAPEQAAVRVLLNMNSAVTGTPDADDALKSAEFFNPAQFPTAQYVARGAQALGSGKYVLNGRLTLKGVTKPVSLPFLFNVKAGTARVSAETKINRLDFGVGQETVAGLAVDNDVKLTIDLTAVRLDN